MSLLAVKKERNKLADSPGSNVQYNIEYIKEVNHQKGTSDVDNTVVHPKRLIKVKGNPNLVDVKTVMIGIRNPAQNGGILGSRTMAYLNVDKYGSMNFA